MARRRAGRDSTEDSLEVDGNVFLGRLLDQLSATIEAQTLDVFDDAGIVIPVRSCSMMLTIDRLDDASTADLAEALAITHQLATQKLARLGALGLVKRVPDRADVRRKRVVLTPLGRRQIARFRDIVPQIERAYADLTREIGDVADLLRRAQRALDERPIDERI